MTSQVLQTNILSNYIGQFYTTCIGILILPLFLQYTGAEAYGLIGFFTLIASWMQLLDMGITPALGREVAQLKGKQGKESQLITMINTLETMLIVVAVLFGFALFSARGWIATDWLTFEELPQDTVKTSIGIIAIAVSTRWVSTLNRSGVNAYESQVWMNMIDIIFHTFRFPIALCLIIGSKGNIILFFYFQLLVSFTEFVIIRNKLRKLMPSTNRGVKRFDRAELKRIAPFTISIGYAGAIWTLLTQLDKLVLSKILPLGEYGYFTLIATITSGLLLMSSPVSKAILPRMVSLLASGDEEGMLNLYRRSTRFVVSIIAPITFMIALKPDLIIYVWTGDRTAADWTAPVLPLFAIGSGILTITAFQYYLQYAHGQLKYHIGYNTVLVILNAPLIIYAAYGYGVIGVAWVWLVFRALSFLIWLPFIHQKFAPGLHVKWLTKDVLPPVIISMVFIWLFNDVNLFNITNPRMTNFALLAGLTLTTITLGMSTVLIDYYKYRING